VPIDQSDLRIAFYEDFDAIQRNLCLLDVAGKGPRPNPSVKLELCVTGITRHKNLALDTVDEVHQVPSAMTTRRDGPERPVTIYIRAFSKGRQFDTLGHVDIIDFFNTG
jgi:hypothetical protein